MSTMEENAARTPLKAPEAVQPLPPQQPKVPVSLAPAAEHEGDVLILPGTAKSAEEHLKPFLQHALTEAEQQDLSITLMIEKNNKSGKFDVKLRLQSPLLVDNPDIADKVIGMMRTHPAFAGFFAADHEAPHQQRGAQSDIIDIHMPGHSKAHYARLLQELIASPAPSAVAPIAANENVAPTANAPVNVTIVNNGVHADSCAGCASCSKAPSAEVKIPAQAQALAQTAAAGVSV